MQQEQSVAEERGKDIVSVKAIRLVNRAARARDAAIHAVIERIDVYAAISEGVVVHPQVKQEHAARIVDAVLALTGGVK